MRPLKIVDRTIEANFVSNFPIWIERPIRNFQKGRAVYPTALLEGVSSNTSSSGVSGLSPLRTWNHWSIDVDSRISATRLATNTGLSSSITEGLLCCQST